MSSGQIQRLLALEDPVLREGRLGLLCNQTAYDPHSGRYLFELLAERGVLQRVLIPEHGLFAELQDQVGLDEASAYATLAPGVEFVSLYGSESKSLLPEPEQLADLDALVIDLQDVGSRYYTFAVTASYLLAALAEARSDFPVYVIDRPNPAGRQVEGTPLQPQYESFVGRPGLPHRHGLTLGELCTWFAARLEGSLALKVVRLDSGPEGDLWIGPSPNMQLTSTALVYSGQCLLEGTNVSEGRGTTRPFEIFGAPWIDPARMKLPVSPALRPLRFMPTFHKYAGETCSGWQLTPPTGLHALSFSLLLIRSLRQKYPEFAFRRGQYEFRSDRPAIDILVGDDVLLDFVKANGDYRTVQKHLAAAEADWISSATPHLLYEQPLRRTDSLPAT